jgi:hypothetical protein
MIMKPKKSRQVYHNTFFLIIYIPVQTPRHAEAAGEAKRWTRGHIGDGAAASPTAPNGMADQAAGDDETGAGGIDDGG